MCARTDTDDSVARADDTAGRPSIPCPRCGTPVALVRCRGPTTCRAAPCGCRVPTGALDRNGDLERPDDGST
ncbi:hypothetical protein C493_13933 [Natronolimnohabitans innermongolicus JCM 12255]|uniref:Small CPxCG-related zinc finger protein n=1 Tax=Natronolimnohabitans innermongolicus JCM 12255 TaxID=1227499 RepID=L9WWR6_9EURY|nr:hypothetical protein C493_13933 [Natronolimnohabitans innermongolicus JCM 12255]